MSVNTAPFVIERVLVVLDDIGQLCVDERFSTLVNTFQGNTLRITVFLRKAPDVAAAQSLRDRFIQPRLTLRFAEQGESVESLLPEHEALIAGGSADDKSSIVRAWQQGLCVINSPDQAKQVAGFSDIYVEYPTRPAKRWYSIMEGNPLIVANPQKIVLGYGARINPRAAIFNESWIEIGRGSLLGADAELNLFTARLKMGQFCQTSSYFATIGSRHTLQLPATFAVSRGPFAFLGETADKVGDIVIGNDVWFGTRVVVLPGIHVADGCVVGAGSVVTKSLTQAYGIYAGNPAKLIRFRFPPHVIKWLSEIQWWNWPTKKLWETRSFFHTDISNKTEKELWELVEF